MTDLLDLDFAELQAFCVGLGERPFRARQLWQWLWAKGCADVAEMTDLALSFRRTLAAEARVLLPAVQTVRTSRDGTVKFLLGLADGARIETVLIPEEGHLTQCLSTQVGCPLACRFCSTGQAGFVRNLRMAEILGQVLVARRWLRAQGVPRPLRNVVFMGMGEPLLNLPELMRSLRAMRHPLGLDLSGRRITVSTVGLPKGLEEFGQSGLASLAVSLHAPSQELRARLMPKAAQVPLAELMACLKAYPLKPRQRLTFEYLLLRDVNDGVEHARQLVRLLSDLKAKVNLIAFNPAPGADALRDEDGRPFAAPSEERILAFERCLWDKGLTAVLRRSKGADIGAACGQLRALEGAEEGGAVPGGSRAGR